MEETCRGGDVEALQLLLQKDIYLLDRLDSSIANNNPYPLHIAALLGHADFAREILRKKPGLATRFNAEGLTPLHLASACGHLGVVRELLLVGSSVDLRRLRDKDGLMPIHTAAAKGRVDVLAELIMEPEYTRLLRETTSRGGGGDTVLHLAVKYGCYEAVEFLANKMEEAGDVNGLGLLNSKDDKGNTILHLAVATRQLQIVKLLLTKPGVDMNAVNVRGLTMLDVLLDSPIQCGDLALAEMILAAGGGKTTAGEGEGAKGENEQEASRQSNSISATQFMLLPLRWSGLPWPSRTDHYDDHHKKQQTQEAKDASKSTLMVVATLLATITFQPILNPPGGFDDQTGMTKRTDLGFFLLFDMLGLLASVFVILLLICVGPRRSQMMTRILHWVLFLAVFFTAVAFINAAGLTYDTTDWFSGQPVDIVSFVWGVWVVASLIGTIWIYLRLSAYLFSVAGWYRPTKNNHTGATLTIKRIFVFLTVAVTPLVVAILNPGIFYFLGEGYGITLSSRAWRFFLEIPLLWCCLKFILYVLRMTGWIANLKLWSGLAPVIRRIKALVLCITGWIANRQLWSARATRIIMAVVTLAFLAVHVIAVAFLPRSI